jgi:hypothetical protein
MTGGVPLAVLLAIDDSDVSPGILGFVVVAALGVATWLLLRSMRRQMKKIDFDEGGVAPGGSPPRVPDEDATTPPSGEEPGGSVR